MNSSDDEEGEILEYHVTDYHLEDENGQPISFAALPLWDEEEENHCRRRVQVYLRGSADNGLQTIHKLVVAWKFNLSHVQPEILVFSKEKSWLTLQKPRNSYSSTIAVPLITLHWLHFLKRNPEASRDAIWNHLQKFTSSLDIKPSESDFSDHVMLINEAVKRDKDLSTHQDSIMSLEKPWSLPPLYQRTFQFLNDKGDDDDDDDEQHDTSESIFDPVCAICDNGGSVLCCEGRCLRSFHPTKADGLDSSCESLGFADNSEVDAVAEFLCKNCQYKQHHCYICGELGSSDPSSQEVFPCISATCGHYYHPDCVAKWVFTNNKSQAEKLAKEIGAGESFTCPVHQCSFCKKTENPEVHDQQFAVCRRCPKAYHRKCLPKDITFNNAPNVAQRAWEGLLNFNRILIYCLDHEIVESLLTPMRNHLAFPGCKKTQKSELIFSSRKACASPKKFLSRTVVPNAGVMRRIKSPPKHSTYVDSNASHRVKEKTFGHSSRELNLGDSPMKSLVGIAGFDHQKGFKRDERQLMLSKRKYQQVPAADERASNLVTGKKEAARIQAPSAIEKMERRCLTIIEEAESIIDAQEFMKKHRVSIASTYNSNFSVDKSMTMGRVEASVKAVQAALQMLEAGGSVEDAKSVCRPEVIREILAWKAKLSIYLAPFLHGARYTSFGRHFTKVDKLREIIDRLHWYVQNDDTIVDFCCGSNDFSCLLKEKLEQTSKSCSFKNYDLFHPKNDFNFEKRDWMNVEVSELPEGSQMIMGLNPPFGYKASLANQFINKALEFKPKLLILIVPAETRRVDQKAPYDLIWEEDQLLSQKSFYLPGSFDANEKHLEQWNLKTPPLYLWSRQDWTSRHMKIAQKHGHLHSGLVVTDGRETMSSGEQMVIPQEHNRFNNGQMAVGDEERFGSVGHMAVTGEQGHLQKSEMNTVRSSHMPEEDQLDNWPDFSSIFEHAPDEYQNLWDIGGPIFDQNNYTWQSEQSGNPYVEAEKIETTETPSHGVTLQGDEEVCIDMDISPPSSPSKEGDIFTMNLQGQSGRPRPRVNLGFKQAYNIGKYDFV